MMDPMTRLALAVGAVVAALGVCVVAIADVVWEKLKR